MSGPPSPLRARFVARFVEGARARLARVTDALEGTKATSPDFTAVREELHGLAGEAAVLEYPDLADLARAGEAAARKGDVVTCKWTVTSMTAALERIKR